MQQIGEESKGEQTSSLFPLFPLNKLRMFTSSPRSFIPFELGFYATALIHKHFHLSAGASAATLPSIFLVD